MVPMTSSDHQVYIEPVIDQQKLVDRITRESRNRETEDGVCVEGARFKMPRPAPPLDEWSVET